MSVRCNIRYWYCLRLDANFARALLALQRLLYVLLALIVVLLPVLLHQSIRVQCTSLIQRLLHSTD
jgi:hypothetical protein